MTHRKLQPGKLVIASHNAGKVREIRALLAPFGIEPVSAGELGLPEPEETGTTFAENALLKAHASAQTIKTDIESAFRRKAIIDAHAIDVRVEGGEVTLSGVVGSLPERDMARLTASGTAGVQKVVDNLMVSPSGLESPGST